MPRGFSEHERALIDERLRKAGREALVARGLKKTSIEELTTAAAISKGAFYLFYRSKEELFFAVIQQFELTYQTQLLAEAGLDRERPIEGLRAFLRQAFTLWRAEPLFQNFGREDYEQLFLRLPPEQVAQALQTDERFTAQLLDRWANDGVQVALEPPLLTALMRALFLISLHHDEFDPAVYPQLSELLIEMVAERIVHNLR